MSEVALELNTGRSYRAVARELARRGDDDAFADLADITRSAWPSLSDDYLARWADVIFGTADGRITVAYKVRSYERLFDDAGVEKVHFQVEAALGHAYLIGSDQLGGPWQRGEARGTRRIETPAEVEADVTWMNAVVRTARSFAPDVARERLAPSPPASTVRTDLHVRPDGTVVLTVPLGTPVLVQSAAASG